MKPSQFLIPVLLCLLQTNIYAQGTKADYKRAAELSSLTRNKVFKQKVDPQSIPNSPDFWYRIQTRDDHYQFIHVNPAAATRNPAFNHDQLATELAKQSKQSVTSHNLPFNKIQYNDSDIQFKAFNKSWSWNDKTSTLKQIEDFKFITPPKPQSSQRNRGNQSGYASTSRTSPDKKWIIHFENHNLTLESIESKEKTKLTTNGTEVNPYHRIYWAPNSNKFIAIRTKRGTTRYVNIIESSPKDQLQPKIHRYSYLKPGDDVPIDHPHLFDITTKKELPVPNQLFNSPYHFRNWHWRSDSSEFIFWYNKRGHQALKLIAINAQSGNPRLIVDEQSKTFVDYAGKAYYQILHDTNEVIWMSERDGYNHLYLYDLNTGQVKNQITKGNWVVRKVAEVNQTNRTILLQISGYYPDQDPYYNHYARVNFDGSNFTILTDGDGTHDILFSPDQNYILDSYSRVDMPGITELRNAKTGKLICTLETADHTQLLNTGWQPPERFVAKARDNKTDIHGVIWRPTNFDPSKNYPVIEYIYAGPHSAFTPKSFRSYYRVQSMAELGFIVVQLDGMGTSHRSKAFHDVCWKNLGDSGFPDRIKWIKTAAQKYPYMDISRVGIYGGSAGGQSSTRALLAFGDFYKVAVSDCGCHDNRMDKIWWNELWMSWPIGPHYAEQSNVTQAHRLTGKLMLVVGELDRNVDPASTMQVINALIKADKDFDMLVIPGAGHGAAESPYGQRRRKDFFVRHLLGVEPRAN